MKAMNEKVYIGDGAYAHFDGYHVVVSTSDGISDTNTVCMEPAVLKSFRLYLDKLADHISAKGGDGSLINGKVKS